VIPVNDPPLIMGIPVREFLEDSEVSSDLSDYIDDEDNSLDELDLNFSHPSLVRITNLEFIMLYKVYQPEHVIEFTISDGLAIVHSDFTARVIPVNDPPFIVGIDDLITPYTIVIDEGTEIWMPIHVEDEDDVLFKYTVDSAWNGIWAFSNGTIRIHAEKGDVNEYTATISVEDGQGLTDSANITIIIQNVNDPPSIPIIHSPANHTVVEVGTSVTFSASVSDPDMIFNQVLTIKWISNISDLIAVRTTEDGLEFSTSDLPQGDHRITVRVTDGQYEKEIWFALSVVEPYSPPDDDDDRSVFVTSAGWLLIVAIVILVVLASINYNLYARRKALESEEEPNIESYQEVKPPEH
jgi:hypothetical protein